MNKEKEEKLFILFSHYQKSMDTIKEITASLDNQYKLARQNLVNQQNNFSILNLKFMKEIENLVEEIRDKIEYEEIMSPSIFLQKLKNKNEVKPVSLLEKAEKDPYKFIEKYSQNSEITLYKPNMRESFLGKIENSCLNLYTLRLESDPEEEETQIEDFDVEKVHIFKKISVLCLKDSIITDKSIEFLQQNLPKLKDLDLSGCHMLTDQSLKFLINYNLVSVKINSMNSFSQKSILQMISLCFNLNYLQILNNRNINEGFFRQLFQVYTERRAQLKWLEVTTDYGVDIFVNKLSYLTTSNPIEEIIDEEVFVLLGGKTHIKGLFFDNCQDLTKKSLTHIITNCKKLQRLSLSKFIQLNDGLVQELTLQLPRLKYLDLNCCYNITNNSLYHISTNLTELQLVSLERCKAISDEGLTYLIKKRQNLQYLSIAWCNKITDDSPLYLCQNLTCLNLSNCEQITDDLIERISEKLQNLTQLNLNYCENLTDSSISLIATRLKKLETLEIEWCQVSQKCIRYIAQNLNDLKVLNLSYCPYVCDEEITIISKKLKKLQTLKLQSCEKITSEGFQMLSSNLSLLRILCLKQCNEVNDSFIRSITTKSSNIQFLDLSWCRNITDRALFSLSKNLYCLSHLNLNGCLDITNEGIQWLSATISKVQYLNITLCDNVSDEGVMAITSRMKHLKVLFLCELSQITDISISTVANLPDLEQLHLLGSQNITSSSLICLHNLQKLIYLNVSQCLGIQGQSFCRLCQFMGNIKVLEMSQIQVDDDFLNYLAKFCPKLQYLNLCYCKNISDEAAIRTLERLPRLIKFDVQNTNLNERTKEEIFHALTNRKMEKIVIE